MNQSGRHLFARRLSSPYALPIFLFVLAIGVGTAFLHHSASLAAGRLSWLDALFTSTSAVCVTGLTVVDTGTHFSRFGHVVLLCLMQVGGLGIMTYTALVFYLWRQRVSLSDRIALSQSLGQGPSFHLGRFLIRLVVWVLCLEIAGALALCALDPGGFHPFSAIFHAVSAFCNAGFALPAENLMRWQGHLGVNAVFMALIIMGGLGFSVLMELQIYLRARLGRRGGRPAPRLSWAARTVLKTTLGLILGGWLCIYAAEFIGSYRNLPVGLEVLSALFQSVTCRTAGFNTLDTHWLNNVTLLVMVALMFIGGSPGSCAGGVKTTSFRVLLAFIAAQLRGRRQTVVGRYAVDTQTLNNALTLVVFGVVTIGAAAVALSITEGGDTPHPETRGLFLELVFEAVSAFGTVGLSTGITPKLSPWGKGVITLLMFIGRIGPIVFLTALHSVQEQPRYQWPEENLPIG